MIDKKSLVSFLARFSGGKKKTFSKQTIHPRREWFIGVSIFMCVLLCGGLFSVYTFLTLKDMQKNIVGSVDATEQYKKNTVTQALALYEKKKERFSYVQSQKQATSEIITVESEIIVETASSSLEIASTTVTGTETPASPVEPALLEEENSATSSVGI